MPRTTGTSRCRVLAMMVSCALLFACSTAERESPDAPNIIVYVVDALRADALGSYGGPIATPHFDRLASGGVRFRDAWATSSWTRATVGSLFTGLYPTAHGAVGRDSMLRDGVSTLAERLRLRGYRTFGVVANGNAAGTWGFDQGFDVYEHLGAAPPDGHDDPRFAHARAEQVHRSVLEMLRTEARPESPFFLYVQTVDPHAPYAAPGWFLDGPAPDPWTNAALHELNTGRRRVTPEVVAAVRHAYLGEVAYADRRFGDFQEAMKGAGLLDDTVVVLTADHGEQFHERGSFTHGLTLFEGEIRVPLIVRGPGRIPSGVVVSAPASTVDVLPTLLALTGAPAEGPVHGVDLSPAWGGEGGDGPDTHRPVLAELDLDGRRWRALRVETWKLLHDLRQDRYHLFNLAVDPVEGRDLYASRDRKSQQMVDILDLLASRLEQNAPDAAEAGPAGIHIPDEILENLRALGYVR